MDSLQTIVLALVQGITELLPISSSAHLILVSKYAFNFDISYFLLTALHLGTTFAILIYFRDFFFKEIFRREKLGIASKIIVASIPAGVLGVLLSSYIESTLNSELVIICTLLLVGGLMILAERFDSKRVSSINNWQDISLKQAVVMGFSQSLALIPGTSRSGITTVAGIFSGVEKFSALQFSFLMGVPILLGSFMYKLYSHPNGINALFSMEILLGIFVAMFVGLISLKVLNAFSKKRFLTFFGVYRILLALILLLNLVI